MRELHLFDVSQYVYSGVADISFNTGVRIVDGCYVNNSMPCAGITNLVNTCLAYYKKPSTDMVFCFDSPPTYKRELHSKLFPSAGGYKGNRRSKTNELLVQLRMAEEIFKQIGVPYVKLEGYEADDIIASIVKHYRDDYAHIYIHSRDSDMYHLVCDNVTIEPVLKSGKVVNLSNYEQCLTGWNVPYNTLTIHKMAVGESGDNIPRVDKSQMVKIMSEIPEYRYGDLGDNEILRKYIVDAVGPSDIKTIGIFDLIAPRIITSDELEIYESEVDERRLMAYAIECKCRGFYDKKSFCDDVVMSTIDKYICEYTEMGRPTYTFRR